jgi:phospholipid/cholesterol/gamma-HCH transport system substrate-binding protein
MKQRGNHFLVGIFVIVGCVIAVSAMIWVGASKYFEKGARYVTYFDESVQGLQADSTVRYRGVNIGRVEKIGVAPDQRLVEVLMKIDVADFQVEGVAAKLSMAGITGIVYVELDRKKAGEIISSPQLNFKPAYPVIPSSPSEIRQIAESVNDILKSIKQVDLKGLRDQLSGIIKNIDGFVGGKEMDKIMNNISLSSRNLASLTERADHLLAEGNIDKVLTDARAAVSEAKTAVVSLREAVESAKIAQIAGKIDRSVDNTSKKVRSATSQIEMAAESLTRTAESLETLVDRLKSNPSALIFSSPPPRKGE